MPSTMMSHVLCRFKDRRIVPCARRPQGGCAGDATSSLVKYFPCAHHQPGEIALQKCTNCELIFDIEFSMIQIQKWICPYAQQEKRWKVHDYKFEKMWFSRVRAPRACPHNFYFDHCVYNTLVLCFTKEFLWNFVQEKITLKILKICSFSRFFENDWNTNRWLEKSEHKIIKIHEIRFFIMSYLTVLTSYHTM